MSICVVGGHDKLGELLKAGERHFLRQTDVSVGSRVVDPPQGFLSGYVSSRTGPVLAPPVKRLLGEPGQHTGHTGVHGHTGTRITHEKNVTTHKVTSIQTHQHARSTARPRDDQIRGRLNSRIPGAE